MGKSKKHATPIRRTKLPAYERMQWCRKQWLEDPSIPVQGQDGMIRRMVAVFGVAISADMLHRQREGVLKELEARKPAPVQQPLSMKEMQDLSEPGRPPSATVASSDSPPPTKPPEPKLAVVTPRKRAKSATFQEREIYALQQLRIRPHMSLGGKDGLLEMLRSRFGRGMGYDAMKALKEQVQTELHEPATLKSIMSATPEKRDDKPMPKKEVEKTDSQSAIRTAAELIMDSIPNLKEFVLRVDEEGRTHVDYKQYIIETGKIIIDK